MIGSHLSKTGQKTHNHWTKLLLIQTFLLKRSVPKKSLARTCFLAKKQSVPPKAGLRIRLEKWGEISGTRFARPTFWLPKSRLVRLWCPGQELNLQAFRRYHLKVVRVPISPPGQHNHFIKKQRRSKFLRHGRRRAEWSVHFQQKMIARKNLLCLCGHLFFHFFLHAEISHLAGNFLGGLLTDVIELGSANFGAFQYFYLVYDGRVEGKNFLNPNPGGYTADGEGGSGFGAVLACKHKTFESLEADFALLLDLLPDADSIPAP